MKNIWRSEESFFWFFKENREKLADTGAIMRIGRDWFVDLDKFPETSKRIFLEKTKTKRAE